jgi:hypothetical protein
MWIKNYFFVRKEFFYYKSRCFGYLAIYFLIHYIFINKDNIFLLKFFPNPKVWFEMF